MPKSRKYLILFFVLIFVFTLEVFLFLKNKTAVTPTASVISDAEPSLQQETQEKEISNPIPEKSDTAPDPTPTPPLPDQINLKVPFTSQAPNQNWGMPYQEFCEEASMLMAGSYVKGETISSPQDADKKLKAIQKFEMEKLGFYQDTTAEETATIIREYFNLKNVRVVYDPSVTDIKTALAENKVLILPFAGRQLGNPNFHQPGPLYHMLVIKGYTENGDFITNDPGTKKGADYIYTESVIMNAIHDWNEGNVIAGKKVMIIVD